MDQSFRTEDAQSFRHFEMREPKVHNTKRKLYISSSVHVYDIGHEIGLSICKRLHLHLFFIWSIFCLFHNATVCGFVRFCAVVIILHGSIFPILLFPSSAMTYVFVVCFLFQLHFSCHLTIDFMFGRFFFSAVHHYQRFMGLQTLGVCVYFFLLLCRIIKIVCMPEHKFYGYSFNILHRDVLTIH